MNVIQREIFREEEEEEGWNTPRGICMEIVSRNHAPWTRNSEYSAMTFASPVIYFRVVGFVGRVPAAGGCR